MSRNIAASTVQNIRKSVSGLSNSAQLMTNAANAMIESLNGSGRCPLSNAMNRSARYDPTQTIAKTSKTTIVASLK